MFHFASSTMRSACVAVALAIAPLATTVPAHAQNGPDSIADLAESVIDAVVNISTSQTVSGNDRNRGIPRPRVPEGSPFQEFFDEFFNRQQGENGDTPRRPRRVQSLGSGFVISEDGIIVTNNHVIADADEITVNFNDGSNLVAEVLGRDPKTDLAVLKVEPKGKLKAVPIGDSTKMRVGDWVMAIGNPFGYSGTVTVGIVSARNRDIRQGPYDNFIQTDASINKGNSGGPLFNRDGEVIGINTAIISPTGGSIGIGFSVPTETAFAVIEQLRDFGETRRGWLGVRIQEVTDEIAEGLGMDEATGALVAGVTPTGPAEKSGIEPGDVVLRFDGRVVDSVRDLPRMVADTPVGKKVEVIVLRKEEEVTLSVELGRLEEGEKIAEAAESGEEDATEEEQTGSVSVLGLTVSAITEELRAKHDIAEDTQGVVITEVEEGSAADEKNIRVGEVIVEVSQEPINEPADVKKRIDEVKEEGKRSVLFLLSTANQELRFVAVKLEE